MAAIIFHEPVFATVVESGDKLYFYDVGTTTAYTVYTDFALTTAASAPVVADSDGRFSSLYIDGTGSDFKVVLKDSSDVEKWTCERYPIDDLTGTAADLATAQSDITALDGRLTTAEDEIDTLQTDSTSHDSRLDTLEAATVSYPTATTFSGTSSITGLTAGDTYLVSVYGITDNEGTGTATLGAVVVVDGSSPGGTVLETTGTKSINWPDGNIAQSMTFVVTPTQTSVSGATHYIDTVTYNAADKMYAVLLSEA